MGFLTILFLQSGLNKVFDYQGNYNYLKAHFAQSPLKSTVGVLFPVVTTLEVLAGVFSLAGLFMFLVDNGNTSIGLIGAQLSALCILMLFFGQRLAKDYNGAATLTKYFLVCLAAIFILI
ncbi:MAG: putative membrane protein YphA (DoxX/SURF4 family) [Saprospiraceae bacterium]|jgi:uncharacterized membrane protein YphA (DoxX/SURF4 family)